MMHYFEFFMHGTGHWLGLDVHDAGSTEKEGVPRKLKEGMVTTIEPGIYVRPNKPVVDFPLVDRDPAKLKERRKRIGINEAMKIEKEEVEKAKKLSHKIPENLLGIGVRIEDDIVCTREKPINLTKGVPREVQEIEDLCSS
jgi:Xaa-Pro aminopeptidase